MIRQVITLFYLLVTMFDNYRRVEIPIPMGREPFDLVTVSKTYPATSSSPQEDLCKIHDAEVIQTDLVTGVGRAWIGLRGTPGSLSFIIKFMIAGTDDHHKMLHKEAAVYNEQLASLQGVDIPSLYGLFEGEIMEDFAEEPTPVTCLFLEDCGEALENSFKVLPLADRFVLTYTRRTTLTFRTHSAEILKKLGHIHWCGLTLDDFAERNVVQKDGAYRLIDFQDVEDDHICLWKGGQLHEGDFQPKQAEIGCPELHQIGKGLGLWKLRKLAIAIFLFDLVLT